MRSLAVVAVAALVALTFTGATLSRPLASQPLAYPPPGEYWVFSNNEIAPVDPNLEVPLVHAVLVTLSRGKYLVRSAKPYAWVEMHHSCRHPLPAGTVVATFSQTGAASWSGTIGKWNYNTCAVAAGVDVRGTRASRSSGTGATIVFMPKSGFGGGFWELMACAPYKGTNLQC